MHRSGVDSQPALHCVLPALVAFERDDPTYTSVPVGFTGYPDRFADLVRGMRAKYQNGVGSSRRIDHAPVSGEFGGLGSVSRILNACFRD